MHAIQPSTSWSCSRCCRELEVEDLIRRCNWTPPPPNKQRERNEQCTCSSVHQVSGRVAGSKSKAGNFLSGGVCVWPSSELPTAGVCMLVRIVTAPSHLIVNVCMQVCVRECVTGRESNCKRKMGAEFLMASVFRIHFFSFSFFFLSDSAYMKMFFTNVTHRHWLCYSTYTYSWCQVWLHTTAKNIL